ncbi:hypothetical protein H5Q82_16965, partial [Escherichia coli]|nr:hypothetical protein [Escherichia coli]
MSDHNPLTLKLNLREKIAYGMGDVGSNLMLREGANKRGNSSRLTQSFHFFMF